VEESKLDLSELDSFNEVVQDLSRENKLQSQIQSLQDQLETKITEAQNTSIVSDTTTLAHVKGTLI